MSRARLILALLGLFGAVAAAVAQSRPEIAVVPRTESLEMRTGSFVINPETRIVAGDDESRRVARLFSDYLLDQHGLHLKMSATRGDRRNTISFSQNGSGELPEEGYLLKVGPEGIQVAGRHAGLFYGMQTLAQLLPLQLEPTIELPALEIADHPRFGYRGLLLDVGRHFFTVEYVKKLLDLAAQYKINRFHWHLTDDQGWRIEIKRYPKLTQGKSLNPDDPAYAAYYTQDQIRDIVAYAEERYITIVPEIEMPGHSGAALAAYPELGCAPVETAVAFCPKAETFEFLENVLSEVVELFPGPYIHIGGDEVEKEGWRQSPEAQAILAREGLKDEDELQSFFIRRIGRFLAAKHRRMIGWDEILQGGLAPDAIVMSWRGEAGGIEAVRMKHSAIMSPTDYTYFDYYQGDREREPVSIGGFIPLAKAYRYEPVPKELGADDAAYILGAQANLWTEYVATPDHAEYMVFPRLLAFSESVWSPASGKDYGDFLRRLPYQLGRLEKQAVNYRIPEPVGFGDFYTTTEDHTVVDLHSLVTESTVHYTLDGSDPTADSPRFEAPLQISLPPGLKTTLSVLITAPVRRQSVVYRANFLRRPYRDAISGVSPQPGLSFELFEGKFASVRDIGTGKPVSAGNTDTLDFAQFGRKTNYGVRFDGYVNVEADGFYRFAVESDDGSLLTIDDEVVVDNDGDHGPRLVIGHVPLRRGFHKFSLRFFQAAGGQVFSVGWAAGNDELQPLAGPALVHQPDGRVCRLRRVAVDPELAKNRHLELLHRRARQLARVREGHVEDGLQGCRTGRQHQDPVREMNGLFDVMGHEHDGMALFRQDPEQLVAHAQVQERVEGGKRLVHVQDLGLHHERARELRPFQHAARQLVRIARLESFQPDHGRIVVGERLALAVHAAVEPEHQVLLDREPGKHRAMLRDQDALGAGPDALRAIDRDEPLVRALESRDDIEQRRFSAARRTDDRDQLPVVDAEAEPLQDRKRALVRGERLINVLDDDLSGHSATQRPSAPPASASGHRGAARSAR